MNIFDPSRLNDPVALTTEWSSLISTRASFRTQTLVFQGEECLSRQTTIAYRSFHMSFILMGSLSGLVMTLAPYLFGFSEISFLPLLVGGILMAGGLYGLLHPPITITFDRQAGVCRVQKSNKHTEIIMLNDIYALQVLHVPPEVNDYDSLPVYELNLVLRNGKRLHVLGHGDAVAVKQDANHLANFLRVPLWDVAKDR